MRIIGFTTEDNLRKLYLSWTNVSNALPAKTPEVNDSMLEWLISDAKTKEIGLNINFIMVDLEFTSIK